MKNHRKSIVCAVLALAGLWLGASVQGGLLLEEHFGVNLELGSAHWDSRQHAWTYPFDLASFVPTRNTDTVDYMVGDWYGSWSKKHLNRYTTIHGDHPGGDEPYDVEAMYFDDDPNNIYIAIVTSFPPPPGLIDPRIDDGAKVATGDLAIDVGLNDPASDGFRYDYGVNINHEIRTDDGAQFGDAVVGNEVYRTANSDWYLGTPDYSAPGSGQLTNFDPNAAGFSGTSVGAAQVAYYRYTFPDGKEENGFPTYVIEAVLPRLMLGGLTPGQTVGIQWLPGCRNDSGTFVGDIDTQAVPAPATLLLLVAGGAAAGVGRKWGKKRRGSEAS